MGILAFLFLISVASVGAQGCKKCRHDPYLCVGPRHICDGKKDCIYGEDEAFCDRSGTRTCPASELQCPSGRCLHKMFFCDSSNNCGDNTDEFYCDSMEGFDCPRFWRKCRNGRRCVQDVWWCDGQKDCPDASDEAECQATTSTANQTTGCKWCSTAGSKYLCAELHHLCDGHEDCAYGEDETFCDRSNKSSCPGSQFLCSHGLCMNRTVFCDGEVDCWDNSDEFYCGEMEGFDCPPSWVRCEDGNRCIQGNWWCDGVKDCKDSSDESNCTSPTTVFEPSKTHRDKGVQWLLGAVKGKRGHELPRTVLALFLSSPGIFAPGNRTGRELKDRLTIRVLSQIARNSTVRSQELALHVQALLVACHDPRDFFGRDLVSELRERVDRPSAFSNPSEILALCNAGGDVTAEDVQRVSAAFDSLRRPFWTEVRATATLAMRCLSSRLTGAEEAVRRMQRELTKRQFLNGTVGNLVTTALVLQALWRSSVESFDPPAALEALLRGQGEDGSWGRSVRNAFYVLPAISGRSLLDINNHHCPEKKPESGEEEPLEGAGEGVSVQVWMGSDVHSGRTWKVRVQSGASFYDLIETVARLDHRLNVTYEVVDGKPFVRALLGREDDPEMGIFWFAYVRNTTNAEPPTLLESSPVDVLVNPDQEFIMWYKPNSWRKRDPE